MAEGKCARNPFSNRKRCCRHAPRACKQQRCMHAQIKHQPTMHAGSFIYSSVMCLQGIIVPCMHWLTDIKSCSYYYQYC